MTHRRRAPQDADPPSDYVCRYTGGLFFDTGARSALRRGKRVLARIVPPLEAPYDFGAFGEVNMQLNAGILALTQDYDGGRFDELGAAALAEAKGGKSKTTRGGNPRRVSLAENYFVHLRNSISLYFTTRVPRDSL